jgi:C-terminal processing protease CtpA/Prc
VWTVCLRHLTDATLRSALLEVPSVIRPDRERLAFSDKAWTVSPGTPRIQAKIAFLTGGQAISAAETLMGIVEHHRLGAIVGSPTAGTNGNVNVQTLPGGYRVAWTGMRVRKQDGSRHHGVGIRPTVPVSRTVKGVIAGRDEVLERAVAIVSQ